MFRRWSAAAIVAAVVAVVAAVVAVVAAAAAAAAAIAAAAAAIAAAAAAAAGYFFDRYVHDPIHVANIASVVFPVAWVCGGNKNAQMGGVFEQHAFGMLVCILICLGHGGYKHNISIKMCHPVVNACRQGLFGGDLFANEHHAAHVVG